MVTGSGVNLRRDGLTSIDRRDRTIPNWTTRLARTARIQVLQAKGTTLSAIYHTALAGTKPAKPSATQNTKPGTAADASKPAETLPGLKLPVMGGTPFDLIINPNQKRAQVEQ
jgi:hypothetical protein